MSYTNSQLATAVLQHLGVLDATETIASTDQTYITDVSARARAGLAWSTFPERGGMMSEAMLFIGGISLGAIITLAIVVRWPWLVFLKRGDL